MELDILKHFVKHEVEVLVGGVWIEGLLLPIAKGVIVLAPVGEAESFYGPASMKAESIQAIRQIRRANAPIINLIPQSQPDIKSSFDSTPPKHRFSNK